MTRVGTVAILTISLGLAACAPPKPASSATDAEPLLLNISIHVEGYQQEDDNTAEGRQVFQQHEAMLLELAAAAAAADPPAHLTFEISPIFVAATALWDSDFIAEMDARGHDIVVHADYGGSGFVDRGVFTAELVEQREAIEDQGVDVDAVSGICSPSEWVEAAIDAGFDTTTGMVEFCLSSIPSYGYPLPCGDRADECHDPAVTDWDHRMHPWRTSTSTDWLTDDPNGELLLVSSAGQGLHCLSEDARGQRGCGPDPGDITLFQGLIEDYLAERVPGEVDVLSIVWSIGAPTNAGFDADLFEMVSGFDASEVQWATIETVAAAVS